MADAIDAPCRKDYFPAVHTSGSRPLKDVKLVVLHDEESSSARSAAAFFRSPSSGGSAHIAVDDAECQRCLPNSAIPWGAPGANEQGFHIEQAGYAKWSAVVWRRHIRTLKRAAYKAALHCQLFGIPVQFLHADELRAGKPGITTHRECTKAFGGTHTDPGAFYPLPLFMWLCRRYRKQLG